MLQATGDNFIF